MAFNDFPQVNIKDDLPQILEHATQIKFIVKHYMFILFEAMKLHIFKTCLVALVFIMFSTDADEFDEQFNLLFYLFFFSGAILLSLLF
jgi:hypothetical protein